jgi:hypothetical protein
MRLAFDQRQPEILRPGAGAFMNCETTLFGYFMQLALRETYSEPGVGMASLDWNAMHLKFEHAAGPKQS